jgi:multisubunit Na+/H+ antiporter MnhG subunit
MKNELTIEEARRALKDLEATRSRARNRVFADIAALPLMVWGLIWAFCHLNGYFYLHRGHDVFGRHPDATAQWVTWSGLAVTFAFIILKLRFSNPIRSEGSWCSKYRAPLLTVVWFVFHAFSSELHQFESGRQMNAYYSMYWMLLFIVYGFWLASGLFLSVGVLVCCCAVIGYYFLPEHYSLVMGLGAGGTLFVGGLFSLIRCRRSKSDEVEAENG